MAGTKRISGVEKANANLKKISQKVPLVTMQGLIKSAIIIRRSMDKESPIVPVDTRNLDSSFFTVTSTGSGGVKGGDFSGKDANEMKADHEAVSGHYQSEASKQPKNKPTLILGFSANYATFVHEAQGVKFRRPGSGAKFFSSAIERNQKKIEDTMAKEAKKGIVK